MPPTSRLNPLTQLLCLPTSYTLKNEDHNEAKEGLNHDQSKKGQLVNLGYKYVVPLST